jgi:hypothetical protein
MGQNRPRQKTIFGCAFNPITHVQPLREKYFYFFFSENMDISAHPASSKRGVRVVTIRRGGEWWPCGVASALSKECGRAIVVRTVKPRGPDTSTLVSSLRRRSRVAQVTVAKKPDAPGRSRSKPFQPLRREGREFRPSLW